MRRLFSILFTAMLTFGSFAAWGQAPEMMPMGPSNVRGREIQDLAYGRWCGYNEETFTERCRYFEVSTLVDTMGGYEETRVVIQQTVNQPNRWGYRYVNCPVPESVLRVKNKSADVDVSFDSEGPGCDRWGYAVIYDPETGEYTYEDWSYFGMITLQAQLSSPGFVEEFHYTERFTRKDNVNGTSETNQRVCSGGYSYNVLGGGFTMYGDSIFGNTWFSFDSDEVDGGFQDRKCSQIAKAK